jgi:CheY-like chemotaxis protein
MTGTILILDDDEAIRNALEAFFANQGWQAYAADASFEALEILKSQDIDIVISDIVRPDGDGLEFTQRLKNDFGIPVVIISGSVPDFNSPPDCFSAGADAVLKKPVRLADLLKAVNGVFNKRRINHENAR